MLPKTFILFLLSLAPRPAWAQSLVDAPEVMGPYERASRERLKPDSSLDIYIKQREKLFQTFRQGNTQQAEESCRRMAVRADDFEVRAICAQIDRNANTVPQLLELFEESLRTFPGTVVPARVGNIIENLAYEKADVVLARQIYERSMASLPPAGAYTRLDLLWTVSNIYTAPNNSRAIIREGMQIYDELERSYRSSDLPGMRPNADVIAFNKGHTYMDSLGDLPAALVEFEKVPAGSRAYVNAQVYKSWVLLQLGHKDQALQVIQAADIEGYENPSVKPSLLCYREMILHALKQPADLQICTHFTLEMGPELIQTVTKNLMAYPLPERLELQLLRQFWTFFDKQIAPSMQKTADDNFNAMELARIRGENAVKNLELQRFNLLKLVALGLVVSLGLTILMLVWLRSKNQRIEKLQKYIKQAVLSRFLPPVIVDEILEGRSRLEAEPKEELVTLMFCDIIGFTAISGGLGVQKTATLLHDFMLTVTDVVYQHQGTIDKFIGDAAMVIFGAPTPLSAAEQARRAVDCAQHLLRELQRFPDIAIRIGINQGVATVGIFGSEKRSDFTAIGPSVNLASRIEGRAGSNEILVSASVAAKLPADLVQDRGWYELRGIEGQVRLYQIVETTTLLRSA